MLAGLADQVAHLGAFGTAAIVWLRASTSARSDNAPGHDHNWPPTQYSPPLVPPVVAGMKRQDGTTSSGMPVPSPSCSDLSVDYEVFLLTAVQESYDRTGDNAEAVVDGVACTVRVITAAAIIVCVFATFVSTTSGRSSSSAWAWPWPSRSMPPSSASSSCRRRWSCWAARPHAAQGPGQRCGR